MEPIGARASSFMRNTLRGRRSVRPEGTTGAAFQEGEDSEPQGICEPGRRVEWRGSHKQRSAVYPSIGPIERDCALYNRAGFAQAADGPDSRESAKRA